jgi:hypothetical protein
MTAAAPSVHHSDPRADRVLPVASVFGLVGGPLAWFVQMCAGYALASWPCFPKDHLILSPLAGYAWTLPAMVIGLAAGVAISLAALFVSWRAFDRTRRESEGRSPRFSGSGAGCTRFLALWGMLLGGGFALTTVITAVAFVVVPRCAG